MKRTILTLLCLVSIFTAGTMAHQVEEFYVHGPMDLHNTAMNTYMEMRKVNPNESLTSDGEFLRRANAHAIKRMRRKPEESLLLRVRVQIYSSP